MFAAEHAVRHGLTAIGSVSGYLVDLNMVEQTTPSIAQFSTFLERGGTAAVLMVVLWAYRRDYQRLSERDAARQTADAEERDNLLAMMNQQSESAKQVAVSMTQNTEVLRQVAALLQDSTLAAATAAATAVAEAAKTAAGVVQAASLVAEASLIAQQEAAHQRRTHHADLRDAATRDA